MQQKKKLAVKEPRRRSLEGLKYKTPFFLFSKEKIKKNIRDFQKYFPKASIYYAMKANAEPEILDFIDEEGVGFEVASKYELEMLEKIDVPPEKIIYGTAVKPRSHIKAFVEYGVDRFAADSLQEIEKIATTAPRSKVYIRAVVNDAGSVFKFSEKFGTSKNNIVPLLLRAKELGLVPYGISFNVGSQASNVMAWAEAIKGLAPIIEQLQKVGIKIETLNIGGGYPCEYASTEEMINLKDIAKHIYHEYNKLPYRPKLILEPGRGIVADAGVLTTTVIARVERSEYTWLFLDAGAYNALFEAMEYQGSMRYKVTSVRQSFDAGESVFALAGPTGDSQDIIGKEIMLPKDIEPGDRLVFHNVGAYNLVAVTQFNGFPKPPVYFVDNQIS